MFFLGEKFNNVGLGSYVYIMRANNTTDIKPFTTFKKKKFKPFTVPKKRKSNLLFLIKMKSIWHLVRSLIFLKPNCM